MPTRRFIRWAVAAMLAASRSPWPRAAARAATRPAARRGASRACSLWRVASERPAAADRAWRRRSSGSRAGRSRSSSRRMAAREPHVRGRDPRGREGREGRHGLGRRARFDTVGVTSFQALVAPLLIDSYDLQAQVFERGTPRADAGGRRGAGSRRDRRAPGPDAQAARRVQALRRARGLRGRGRRASGLRRRRRDPARARRARPRPVPAGAQLDGLDAYEQQLGSIAGNSYDASAEYVTANVNLWPRPLVIVMGKEVFASLTDEQQSALREAAAAAIPDALAASRAEDDEAAADPVPPRPDLRRRFRERPRRASSRARAGLRGSDDDPETKSYVAAITASRPRSQPRRRRPCATPTQARVRVRGGIPGGHVRDDGDRGGLATSRGSDGATSTSACSGWSSTTAS